MSEQPTFSLAIVRGQDAGRTLRSARKRISVGSARDNDLVLTDPKVAPRHFLVLIDGGRWRIHSLTGEEIDVDRRWSHPASGKRGALIRAAGCEIVLYPGDLDQRTVDAEVARRASDDEMATSVNLPKLALEDPNEPTVAVKAVDATTDPADLDLVEMAAMPTIAGERPPDELREAAQQLLKQRRAGGGTAGGAGPVAPSVLRESSSPDPLANAPVKGNLPEAPSDERTVGLSWEQVEATAKSAPTGRARSKWDRARRGAPRAPDASDQGVPEILATPESQIMSAPGSSRSTMSRRPDLGPSSSPEAEVIPIDEDRRPQRKGNAWGDGSAAGRGSRPPPSEPSSGRNAWGDPASRALVHTPDENKNAWGDGKGRSKRKKKAGWGDGSRSSARSAPKPPGDAGPRGRHDLQTREGAANLVELSSLAGNPDPALEILTHPDGAYATQVRLLGARIEEFAKNLGYRAYMVSSPEPLTGKTTAACNLAFALAEDTQRRIALVEANFRYPRFSEIFGFDERTGLISVLEGRARLHEVGFKLSDRNLLILPSGGRHAAPAEVLAAPRFKALISELADTVDIALIDAPAVTSFADANLILPLVDAAFLVVTEGQTRRSWLGRAVGQLGEARILGSLFNRIPKKTRKALEKERKERLRAKP